MQIKESDIKEMVAQVLAQLGGKTNSPHLLLNRETARSHSEKVCFALSMKLQMLQQKHGTS
ncbi:hypothetical protein [Sutcliffiella sp. BMC8]|uniref:hypothetical protein n=1 Tax=Sutcliffiella sp. BMC8 TaxID=3073243 RepID=UPI0030CE3F93